MRTKTFRSLLLLALALAIVGAIYSLPAIAQSIRAAVVKNIDERGRVPYQQGGQCSGISTCDVVFAAVPANKRLVVETVRASAQISPASVSILSSYLSDGSSNGPGFFPARLYLIPAFTSYLGNFGIQYNFFANAVHFFDAGVAPKLHISINGATTVALSATLTGTSST